MRAVKAWALIRPDGEIPGVLSTMEIYRYLVDARRVQDNWATHPELLPVRVVPVLITGAPKKEKRK